MEISVAPLVGGLGRRMEVLCHIGAQPLYLFQCLPSRYFSFMPTFEMRRFTDADIYFVGAVANLGAIALENARLL